MSFPWEDYAGVATEEQTPPWEDFPEQPKAAAPQPTKEKQIPDWMKPGGLSEIDRPIASPLMGGLKAEPMEMVTKPIVQLPKFTIDKEKDTFASALAKESANQVISIPEFFTSKLGVTALSTGLVAPTLVAGLFTADMAKNVYNEAKRVIPEWDKMTPAEKGTAAASIGAQTLMGVLTGKATVKGVKNLSKPTPEPISEAKPAGQPVVEPTPAPPAESVVLPAEQVVPPFEEKPATEPSILAPEKLETTTPNEQPTVPELDIKPTEQRRIETYGERYIRELGPEAARKRIEHLNSRTAEELAQRPIDQNAIRRLQQEAQNIANALDKLPPEKPEVAPVEKPVEEPAKAATQTEPFEVDDQLIMRSPHTGEDTSVSFRGLLPNGQAVVWTGKSQFPVPIDWLRRKGEKYEVQISTPITHSDMAEVPRTLQETPTGGGAIQPLARLSKEQLIDIYKKEVPLSSGELKSALLKRTSKSLRDDIENARSDVIRQKLELEIARKLSPDIEGIADAAGGSWRTALNKYASDRGWSFQPPSDTTKGEYVAMLALEQAKKNLRESQKPVEPLSDEQIGLTKESEGTKPAEAPVEAVAPSKLEQLTAKVESGQKLTASEKKQYLKLRQEATGATPEAEKPIVGMGGAAIGEKNPKTQIEQLTEAAQGVTPKRLPLGERFKQDIDLTRKREILAEGATKAIGALRDTWNGIKNRWNGIENIDDLLREKGKLSAEIETRGWRVRKFESEMKKAVPSKRDRAAISKWVDAGGDPEVLKRGALETKPEYRQAYIDALDLRGDLLTTAQNARSYFEARLNEAIDAGVLKEGVEDYIHRVYESRPEVAKKVFANVQTGLLQRNPNLAKKRVFDFDFEAEKLGYKPVQSFIDRIALYESSLSKAIAAREFIKKATEMKADDGRPVIDIKGVGIPVENAEGVREGTLIKPKFNPQLNNEPGSPNYRGDYVNKEFPSLSRWKWVSTDAGGKPIFVQGDVAIHPDFVHRINALLEPSRLRYGRYSKITKPMLDVGSAVKQTMLDLSGFHQVQITAHGLEHKVLPWKIVKDIDFNNPNVEGLLKGGITLGGDYRAAYKEGLVGNSITRHVPWLGPVLESYHQWLFQSYIPRIKMTMALQALERNRIRYGKTMTDEQILHKTASQANSAFGELNYIMLERSKTTQDIARLILLAPDFLEARGRFAGEAFTKGGESKVPGFGNEQRAALLLGALTMYVTARIANKIVDDQYHFEPENAFSLVYKGHAYSLRTVQGDILHLLEKPLQFWLNRLNPVYGRTLLEIVTGRDYFGRKRSVPEVLWDSVKNVMPISLRNSRERKLWESMMNSFGVNARRYNATDDAFKLANAWKEKNGIQERGEFIYDAEKDPLRGLKIALSQEDDAGAAKEIKKIFDSKVYDRKRLDAYFKRYASMPFTGSKANDIKFIKSLNEDERKTVEAAKQHKRDMLKLYDQALQKYYAALRTPIQ